jgi:E3 ubiquitin-protein ligase BRE1
MLSPDGKSGSAVTEQDIKNSDLYVELSMKLKAAEREVDNLKDMELRIRVEWGQALATAEAAQKEIEDLNVRHVKRWTDLVEEYPELATKDEAKAENTENDAKAKEITILQHKLTQALENVRQAEGTRKTLQEAVLLNTSLQAKVEEIKSKYTELQRSKSDDAGDDAVDDLDGLLSTPKPKPQIANAGTTGKVEKSDKSSEKLNRDYRRIQKQLAALTESREKAKAKLERAEKERDALQGANSRLLKQAAEKDEMNAKSLSTILHLKQLTDQITKEKENLEQQVKSSQQLALSARLAANARERLSEEVDKERQLMESRVKEWEAKCRALAAEKDLIEIKMTQNRSRMASLLKEVEGAKSRCEELASESTKLQEEKQRMTELLAIAHNDAEEARNQTEQLSKASGGAIVAGFTAEQLHTQVKHLQSRVNCPVCNARDKKCILLRCRHMFCRNCVDETIKNRSRKCPACGIRFDTKDVGDIWL